MLLLLNNKRVAAANVASWSDTVVAWSDTSAAWDGSGKSAGLVTVKRRVGKRTF